MQTEFFQNQNYIYSKLEYIGKLDSSELQGQVCRHGTTASVQSDFPISFSLRLCCKRLFLTTNQQLKEARKPLTRHTDPPHLCIFGLDYEPGQRHMGSRLACQENGSLLESSPVFLQSPATHHHLKYAKMFVCFVTVLLLLFFSKRQKFHISVGTIFCFNKYNTKVSQIVQIFKK